MEKTKKKDLVFKTKYSFWKCFRGIFIVLFIFSYIIFSSDQNLREYTYLILPFSLIFSGSISFIITILTVGFVTTPIEKNIYITIQNKSLTINNKTISFYNIYSIEEYCDSYILRKRHIIEDKPYLLLLTSTSRHKIPRNIKDYSVLKKLLIQKCSLKSDGKEHKKNSFFTGNNIYLAKKWIKP